MPRQKRKGSTLYSVSPIDKLNVLRFMDLQELFLDQIPERYSESCLGQKIHHLGDLIKLLSEPLRGLFSEPPGVGRQPLLDFFPWHEDIRVYKKPKQAILIFGKQVFAEAPTGVLAEAVCRHQEAPTGTQLFHPVDIIVLEDVNVPLSKDDVQCAITVIPLRGLDDVDLQLVLWSNIFLFTQWFTKTPASTRTSFTSCVDAQKCAESLFLPGKPLYRVLEKEINDSVISISKCKKKTNIITIKPRTKLDKYESSQSLRQESVNFSIHIELEDYEIVAMAPTGAPKQEKIDKEWHVHLSCHKDDTLRKKLEFIRNRIKINLACGFQKNNIAILTILSKRIHDWFSGNTPLLEMFHASEPFSYPSALCRKIFEKYRLPNVLHQRIKSFLFTSQLNALLDSPDGSALDWQRKKPIQYYVYDVDMYRSDINFENRGALFEQSKWQYHISGAFTTTKLTCFDSVNKYLIFDRLCEVLARAVRRQQEALTGVLGVRVLARVNPTGVLPGVNPTEVLAEAPIQVLAEAATQVLAKKVATIVIDYIPNHFFDLTSMERHAYHSLQYDENPLSPFHVEPTYRWLFYSTTHLHKRVLSDYSRPLEKQNLYFLHDQEIQWLQKNTTKTSQNELTSSYSRWIVHLAVPEIPYPETWKSVYTLNFAEYVLFQTVCKHLYKHCILNNGFYCSRDIGFTSRFGIYNDGIRLWHFTYVIFDELKIVMRRFLEELPRSKLFCLGHVEAREMVDALLPYVCRFKVKKAKIGDTKWIASISHPQTLILDQNALLVTHDRDCFRCVEQ
jgi:hypothetical protein